MGSSLQTAFYSRHSPRPRGLPPFHRDVRQPSACRFVHCRCLQGRHQHRIHLQHWRCGVLQELDDSVSGGNRHVKYMQKLHFRMMNGPVIALEDAEEAKKAKRGEIAGLQLSAVTIGVFPSEEHSSYRHFQIVAQSFYGRYAMAVQIKRDTFPSIATYRPNERKKRIDYTEEFDPTSMTQFLLSSSLPSIVSPFQFIPNATKTLRRWTYRTASRPMSSSDRAVPSSFSSLPPHSQSHKK